MGRMVVKQAVEHELGNGWTGSTGPFLSSFLGGSLGLVSCDFSSNFLVHFSTDKDAAWVLHLTNVY